MNPLEQFVTDMIEMHGQKDEYTRSDMNKVNEKTKNGKGYSEFYKAYKVDRGVFKIQPTEESSEFAAASPTMSFGLGLAASAVSVKTLVPQRDKNFVPFGDFKLLANFIKAKMFFPIYISGESGNGKTKMVYEACAHTNRELIRANITEVTDEDDLIGGYRLVGGETVWQDGPAIEAMKKGAVLLLDEVNLASPKIMCLQPILEGNPIFIKKTNTLVHPAEGFTVIATANTKGKSSEDGRYIGSNILNEAMLDRFAINICHEYPNEKQETAILTKILEKNGKTDDDTVDFAGKLVKWASYIRQTNKNGGIADIITTRRLIHILNFYCFGTQKKEKAIEYCISRFDDETRDSFMTFYQKIDENIPVEQEKVPEKEEEYDEIPF